MKIFKSAEREYSKLGICLRVESTQAHPFNSRIIFVLSVFCIGITLSGVYLFHVAKTFKEYTFSFYVTSGMLTVSLCFVFLFWKIQIISTCLDCIEKDINERCMHAKSRAMYTHANGIAEKACKVVLVVITKFLFPGVMILHFILSYWQYFAMDMQADAFVLLCPFWFPFDWENPFGYLIAFALEYITVFYMFQFIACSIGFEFGLFFFITTMVEDFKCMAKALKRYNQIELLFTKQLCDFTKFYSTAKQNVHDLSKTIQPIQMIVFWWSTSAIALAMFQINSDLLNNESIITILVVPAAELGWSIGPVFIFCEFCERIIGAFEEICDEIMKFKWYSFPLGTKKMLLTLMSNVQQPLRFECFGSISSNRDTFKQIIKNGFSYFMVLRQFGK